MSGLGAGTAIIGKASVQFQATKAREQAAMQKQVILQQNRKIQNGCTHHTKLYGMYSSVLGVYRLHTPVCSSYGVAYLGMVALGLLRKRAQVPRARQIILKEKEMRRPSHSTSHFN